MAERYRAVARITKAHGRSGEVVTVPVGGLPPLLHGGLEVAVVPPQLRRDRFHEVLSAQGSGGTLLVALSGVDDRSLAEDLVGSVVLVREGDLPDIEEEPLGPALIGLSVIDETLGCLGRVDEVIEGAAHATLRVTGSHGEVLIPAVDAFIIAIDEVLHVQVPQGLVGLNGPGPVGEDG